MMENLPEYFEHVKCNPDSLIARIYGIFQVRMEGMVPVNLLLMANTIQVFDSQSDIPHIYDLKGSWIHRIVTPGENQTKKDRNFLNCLSSRAQKNKPGIIQFYHNDIKKIKQTIEKDVEFLKEMGFLDYSLLLAVEKIKNETKKEQMQEYHRKVSYIRETLSENSEQSAVKNRHRFFSTCGNYVYHISIIDYLTEFRLFKQFEVFYKVKLKGNKSNLVSVVHPSKYGDRFRQFINNRVIINENSRTKSHKPFDSQQQKDYEIKLMHNSW